MTNFKIVEDTRPRYLEKYEEFIKLYNNPNILKGDIPKKLGWTHKTYQKARHQAIKDGRIPNNPTKANPRYYHYDKNRQRWVVHRNGRGIHIYVTCNSKIEAHTLVKFLNKYGWTKLNVYRFQREVWPYHENNPLRKGAL